MSATKSLIFGEKHTDAHDIIETLAGRLEKRREILEDAVRLGRNTSRHQLASRRVLADLTAEIDETAGFNGLGKRADRRRTTIGVAALPLGACIEMDLVVKA